jgi:DNA recombination protein RmuC
MAKKMIVDSKVSLTAYEKYINEEDDEVKVGFKEHVNSIKRHVEQLGNKLSGYKLKARFCIYSYRLLLLNETVWPAQQGIQKNIVIVTPATLLLCVN